MTEPAKATASATAAATRRAGSPRRGLAVGGRPATPHSSTAVRVRALLPSLSPAERRVAQVVLKEPALVATRTITELAERANTSETTVIRFCRALGVTGYPELRLTLATEAGRLAGGAATRRVVDGDIGPGDDLAEVVEKVTYADATSVEDTAAQLDIDVLRQVVAALAAANRVDIHGVGASGVVALDFQQKLHRVGRVAFAWSDPHVALTSVALLGPGDVAVAISHTGASVETIGVLTEAGRRGATTVALTNFPKAPITLVADHVLTTAARETTFRSGELASRLAALTVVDCLFVGVAQHVSRRKNLPAASGSRHDGVS